MDINFEDRDVAEINMKVAEQCLIKASIESNRESKVKALIFARQSIDGALFNLGIDEKTKISSNVKNNKMSLVKNKT
jgi:hypothetical protein